MRHQLVELLRTRKAMIAAVVVLALFILAPAAWSRTGLILQVQTPQVSIVAADDAATEAGADTGTFTISRTGDTSNALTINLSTGGTATNGGDYTSISTTVVLGASQASVGVVVVPIDDAAHEGSETAVVTLTGGTGYTIGSPAAASVTITDNDLPSVSVTATDASAAEAGSNTGSFTITRTGATTAPLTVGYTLTGTATNGTDYSALSTSVVIPAGQTSASVTVTPTNDGDPEPAETVSLTAAANTLYTVGSPAAATVTISDNDLPTVSVTATDASAGEAGPATGTFTVTRGGDLSAAMTVNYTIGGSAINGADYGGLTGAVVIPAGATSATVVVTPVDDSTDEANETVMLNLAAGSGYQIGSSNSASVTIADNDGTPSNPPTNPPPANPPSNPGSKVDKSPCKDGGWRSLGKFKNQGDCVSWFATDGKNPPSR